MGKAIEGEGTDQGGVYAPRPAGAGATEWRDLTWSRERCTGEAVLGQGGLLNTDDSS